MSNCSRWFALFNAMLALVSNLYSLQAADEGCAPISVTRLKPFRDRLPIASAAIPARTNLSYRVPAAPSLQFFNVPEYDMVMIQTNHQFHLDLTNQVPVWAYNGQYPGPTIDAEVNAPILVNWTNQLPATYPPWLGDTNEMVRTVVHLHGGAVLPRYDGYPTNCFFSGQGDQYFYQNLDLNPDGETLWYHDHANMVTANNVYAGLAGFYLLRNSSLEATLQLPSGTNEICLLLQDKDLFDCGTNVTLALKDVQDLHALAVVNGKVTPYVVVEPKAYRFRVLNGSTYRTWQPTLVNTDTNGVPSIDTNTPPFIILGTEDGFLPQATNASQFAMMPGERMDLVIDFSQFANQNLTLVNNPGGGTSQVNFTNFITHIMQFRVTNQPAGPSFNTNLYANWNTNFIATTNLLNLALADTNRVERQIMLDFVGDTLKSDQLACHSAHTHHYAVINMRPFDCPITEFPVAGESEIWWIVNLTSEAHPVHLHLLDFRVIGRFPFLNPNTNATPSGLTNYLYDRLNGNLAQLANITNYIDPAKPRLPLAYESGPKDTVRSAPQAVTAILVQWPGPKENPDFEYFYTTASASDLDPATRGRYIYHCHILPHEDDDMMRPMQLLPPAPTPSTTESLMIYHMSPGNEDQDPLVGVRYKTRRGYTHRLLSSPNLAVPSSLWDPVLPSDSIGTGETVVVPQILTGSSRAYRLRSSIVFGN